MNTQEEQAAPPSAPARAQTDNACASFDISAMHRHPKFFAVLNWLADYPQREYWMGFFRRFCPIWRVPLLPGPFRGLVIVFRDEDVREVLAHDRDFPVPWGGRMVEVTGKKNFVLGMKDGPEYRRNYRQLAKAFEREDVAKYVVPMAAKAASEILARAHVISSRPRVKKRIDAVRDLIWGVPSRLCEDYYGIEIPDKLLLAKWTVAMSSYLFGSPSYSNTYGTDLAMIAADRFRTRIRSAIEKTRQRLRLPVHARGSMERSDQQLTDNDLALTAAGCFRNLIRSAIEKTRQGDRRGIVLPRLIDMQRSDPQLTDDVLEAHLFGMVTGFIPTDLLAGGNMLNTLLSRHDFMAKARKAALDNDDDLLWRCLQETLRFRHFNLGPFRICGPGGYKLAAGSRRQKDLAPDTPVLASTQSAMFDPRQVARPRCFDPDRAAEDYMVFGYGQHWCLGAYIAIAQITQTFKALLRKSGLRRAHGRDGKLRTITTYPAHLTVEFDE